MTLANVIGTRTGTPWTIDVTAAQLSNDITEKDFSVLHNGIAVPNNTYTKTTPTSLTYTGAAVPANTTIEIRRKTSFDNTKNYVSYSNRFSGSTWNNALARIQRWEEEVDLNGAGAIGAGVIPLPANDAYGSVWTNDIIYSPTRKVLWDKIETLANRANPTFTGLVTVPSITGIENTNRALSHKDALNALALKADLASPSLSGTPTTPTVGSIANTTQILNHTDAATALALKAPLASPALTGTPTAPSIGSLTNTNQIITHSDVTTGINNRLVVQTSRVTALSGYAINTLCTIPFSQTTPINVGTVWNTSNHTFTVSTTAWYRISAYVSVGASGGTAPTGCRLIVSLATGTTEALRVLDTASAASSTLGIPITFLHQLTGGTAYFLGFFYFPVGGSGYTVTSPAAGANFITLEYVRA